jgi:uncharacterized membrane protein YeiH
LTVAAAVIGLVLRDILADLIAMILLFALALYILIGLVTAVAFVTFGISQVLPPAATVTAGARILVFPGAAALWPYVLTRWLTSRSSR